jgi:hypothetical protein
VTDGRVDARAGGTARIIAIAANKADTAQVAVAVVVDPVPLGLTPTMITMALTDSVKILVSGSANHFPITWEMSTPGVVEVSATHVLTAKMLGSLTLTARGQSGAAAQATVIVR